MVAASQASSDYDHDETLAKMVRVAEAEVLKKHKVRVKKVIDAAQKDVNQVALQHAATVRRHKEELNELMQLSKNKLDLIDNQLAGLWSQLKDTKVKAQTAQTDFRSNTIELLKAHEVTREDGAKVIQDILSNHTSLPPVAHFLALDELTNVPPAKSAKLAIKAGRISDVTLVDPTSDEEEDDE